MTTPTGPIGAALRQQAEREQAPARKLLDQMSDRELEKLYARAEKAERERDKLRTDWRQSTQTCDLELWERAEQAEAAPAALHEGEEPPADEGFPVTPAEWIWCWNRAIPELRLDMAGRILWAFETADVCFVMDHKREAPRRKAAEAANAGVRALADEWTRVGRDPNACIDMSDAADALRAALDEPKES